MAFEFPISVQQRAFSEICKQGIALSAGGVRNIWLRNKLEVFNKLLKTLEEGVAKVTIVLAEAQVIATEPKKEKLEAFGEMWIAYPGYLGAQNTNSDGDNDAKERIFVYFSE